MTAPGDAIAAVLSSKDGMASGAVAALERSGMAGLPLSGQGGDLAAVNRVALGTQTTAWKDVRELGAKAAEVADAILSAIAPADLEGVEVFVDAERGIEHYAVPLEPTASTRDNLDLMMGAGWITRDDACRGAEPGTVAACDG